MSKPDTMEQYDDAIAVLWSESASPSDIRIAAWFILTSEWCNDDDREFAVQALDAL